MVHLANVSLRLVPTGRAERLLAHIPLILLKAVPQCHIRCRETVKRALRQINCDIEGLELRGMADDQQLNSDSNSTPGMFAEPAQEKRFPSTAVAIASVAIVILVAFFILMGHRKGEADETARTPQAAASYAPSLAISNIQLSESESISGGKVTYVDGHIANHGSSTVTGVTAQVSFPNDAGTAPQMMTVPLNLIRMREPYIDTQPISAAPLAPNAEADFRLIFEGVNESWNNQPPDIKLIRISTR